MASLLAALSLATYFALVTRSRRNLLLLTIASLFWFGFWRGGCVCPIGATQNVALALFDTTYVVPVTVVVFFTLPLVFTLFFGRTFCALFCPLGAVQELVSLGSVTVPTVAGSCLGADSLSLPWRGRAFRGHRHRLYHLPLRSVRGFFSPLRQREHADLWRLLAAAGPAGWPALLPLPLSLRRTSWGCCRRCRNGTSASRQPTASIAGSAKRSARTALLTPHLDQPAN